MSGTGSEGPPRTPANASSSAAQKTPDSRRAPSIISSRMTDIASDDGDYYPEGAASAQSKGRIGSRGTLASVPSQQEAANRSSPARRGTLGSGVSESRKAVNTFGGPGLSMLNTSRPQTATSRTSRTHVPSIASYAFFRPMSSQKLQAQRGAKPRTSGHIEATNQYSASEGNRHSIGSNRMTIPERQDDSLPPPSRGTEFTEHDRRDRASIDVSPTGHATVRRAGESTRALRHSNSIYPKPPYVHLDQPDQRHLGVGAHGPKSTGSFRSSFLLPSSRRTSPARPRINTQHHQRISSGAASSQLIQEKTKGKGNSSSARNHEYFLGNTVFCWGGRLQNTRDRPVNIATGILVILPATLFLVYSAPYYWKNISPALPIFFAYIFFICISSFIHASLSDPGILPRNLHVQPLPDDHDDPLTLGPIMHDWALIKPTGLSKDPVEISTKFCKSCNTWRPPRGHHCRICDNCVETQDHHCVWLNNCVGRRNYRYFFTFVSSGTLLGLMLTFASLGHCLHYQFAEDLTFKEAIESWRVTFAMFIYGILVSGYPACLTGYHLFLMGRGETTREYLNSHKLLRSERARPFDQGSLFKNWMTVLMRPRPLTYLGFKDVFVEGDQRFGSRRGKGRQNAFTNQCGGEMEMQRVGTGSPSFQGLPP